MGIDVVVGSVERDWARYPSAWLGALEDTEGLVWGERIPRAVISRIEELPPLDDLEEGPSTTKLMAARAAVGRFQAALSAKSGVTVSWRDGADDELFDGLDPLGMGQLQSLASHATLEPGRPLQDVLELVRWDEPFDDPAIAAALPATGPRFANLRTIDLANMFIPVELPHPWRGLPRAVGSTLVLLRELHELADLWAPVWPRDQRAEIGPDPDAIDPRHVRMTHNLSTLIAGATLSAESGMVMFVLG